mmetsp:Transcript_131246/g.311273  ORF Transcript_131246/g.311273 Transcript_131246/m.311273 type:complete len:313 (-) Transcript_131246:264-1202(-)
MNMAQSSSRRMVHQVVIMSKVKRPYGNSNCGEDVAILVQAFLLTGGIGSGRCIRLLVLRQFLVFFLHPEGSHLACLLWRKCVCPEKAQSLGGVGNLLSGAEPVQIYRDGVHAHRHDVGKGLVEAKVCGVVALVGKDLLHVGLIGTLNLHHKGKELVFEVALVKAMQWALLVQAVQNVPHRSEHHIRASLQLAWDQDPHPGLGVLHQGTDAAGHVKQRAERSFIDDAHGDCRAATDVGHQGHARECNSAAGGADSGEEQSTGCCPHKNCDPELDGNCSVCKSTVRDDGAKANRRHAMHRQVQCVPKVARLILD